MTLREITRRPKKALARRSDIDDEPVVQVQRLDTRMGSGLFCLNSTNKLIPNIAIVFVFCSILCTVMVLLWTII